MLKANGFSFSSLIVLYTRRGAALQARAVVTAIYAVEIFVGYVLMLAVMTYNKGLFAAVLLGACTGHFLFAESANHKQDTLLCHN